MSLSLRLTHHPVLSIEIFATPSIFATAAAAAAAATAIAAISHQVDHGRFARDVRTALGVERCEESVVGL